MNNLKLITVTRQDLTAGYQTVQTAHAIADFAYKYPEQFREWRENSNYLACLAVKDLYELQELCNELYMKDIKYITFHESDVDQITAIAVEPTTEAKKACSSIPLANRINGKICKN